MVFLYSHSFESTYNKRENGCGKYMNGLVVGKMPYQQYLYINKKQKPKHHNKILIKNKIMSLDL